MVKGTMRNGMLDKRVFDVESGDFHSKILASRVGSHWVITFLESNRIFSAFADSDEQLESWVRRYAGNRQVTEL